MHGVTALRRDDHRHEMRRAISSISHNTHAPTPKVPLRSDNLELFLCVSVAAKNAFFMQYMTKQLKPSGHTLTTDLSKQQAVTSTQRENSSYLSRCAESDRQTDRQTDSHFSQCTDRQTDRQTDRPTADSRQT